MKIYRIIIISTIFLCNIVYGQSAKSQSKKGGIVEINLPDSIKGYIKFREAYPQPRDLDSIPISNGKCILKYKYLEMPIIIGLALFQNGKEKKVESLFMKNPYDMPYGNIVLDNSHTIIYIAPWMVTRYICNCENMIGSGKGSLEFSFPDSIHGLVYSKKWYGYQFVTQDSARIVDGKCTFHYNTSDISDERLLFFAGDDQIPIVLENIKTPTAWNYLLKNNTLIKANVIPKNIRTGILGIVSGSPETDVQMQLMNDKLGWKDQQGYISKAFIQKYPSSKVLLNEVFDDRSRYSSVDDLKVSLSLFSENAQQSSKGKELANYIKEREEYDKYGISRKFVYFDTNGKQYNFNDCLNGKQLCVVVFWASWCAPCIEEIPRLKEFYKEYKDQISLVSLSVDTDYKKWTERMRQHPVEWLSLSGLPKDKKKVMDDFGTNVVPAFIVLDAKSKIIASQYIQNGNNRRLMELEDVKEIINLKILH